MTTLPHYLATLQHAPTPPLGPRRTCAMWYLASATLSFAGLSLRNTLAAGILEYTVLDWALFLPLIVASTLALVKGIRNDNPTDVIQAVKELRELAQQIQTNRPPPPPPPPVAS